MALLALIFIHKKGMAMAHRVKQYIIPGDPQPWIHGGNNHTNRGLFDAGRLARVSFDLNLRQQHENCPLFNCPLEANFRFFMAMPPYSRKNTIPTISRHIRSRLNELVDYALLSMRGICFADERLIVAITLEKCFDDDPRTEIKLTEVK